ncbi:MAG: type-F conjugative transfer system secretin TraK [Candidatus Paracaedimonas acanthamoebae]|uniref:Type-F conjugative transfer system secretin TraK n=1 Tax=Candidatus Paracaedimonas acanthamoebae TaxID=244581 RepID=A0A8J7Q0V6_9PROT|nr:type-F conjugative transfer system secretin TraK [Candidatus Paracaedimonas acanthamoebae]
MRKFPLLAVSLLAPAASAVQILSIKNHGSSEVMISSTEHTRISVENDRIAQLFGIDGRLSFELDEMNGQVFITPTPGTEGQSLLITLTTEKGLTHDLRVKPSRRSAEAILLRPKTQGLQEKTSPLHSYQGLMLELIKSYATGVLKEPYKVVALQNNLSEKIEPKLALQPIKEIYSPQFIGKVCQVKNEGGATLLLSPHHFAKFKPLAIVFSTRVLKPLLQTEVLLILARSGS